MIIKEHTKKSNGIWRESHRTTETNRELPDEDYRNRIKTVISEKTSIWSLPMTKGIKQG